MAWLRRLSPTLLMSFIIIILYGLVSCYMRLDCLVISSSLIHVLKKIIMALLLNLNDFLTLLFDFDSYYEANKVVLLIICFICHICLLIMSKMGLINYDLNSLSC